jgi:ABC-type cobalamin transport system ATPase subunit
MNQTLSQELAASAARLVVAEGMEYVGAKRKALRALGRHGGKLSALPSNEQVEDEVREYLALFCADTQPSELAELRALALQWMDRLAEFRPHLSGAVWRGTATRLSSIHLDLYCDDAKSAEIALINHGINYDVGSRLDAKGQQIDLLSIASHSQALDETVTLFLSILDHDDLRGALKPDARGRSWRGDAVALRRLLDSTGDQP